MPPPDERPTEIIPLEDGLEPAEIVDEHEEFEHEEFEHEEFEDEEFEDYDEYEGEFYDDEEEFDEAEHAEPEYIEDRRGRRRKTRSKRAFGWVAAIAVIALLVGGAWYGVNKIFGYDDFTGSGDSDVIVQVTSGDSTNAIAGKLTGAGVVASAKAFVKASASNTQISKVQPGYYLLKKNMSGASAVSKIVSPTSRVGELQIKAYTQLDDITQPDGKVTAGIYSLLSKSSCAEVNGKSTCIPVEDLRKTAESADLAALGAPSWAVDSVTQAPQKDRRLEGLIAPGVYDIMPGWTATELLTHMVKASAVQMEADGLNDKSGINGQSPYQTLVIASIIEREAVQQDFGKVSRVIYNRLAVKMKLQMDSTVNYVLDKPLLATNDADRAKPGAYNTYKNTGLPPTPISAPSTEAVQAALSPPAGDWVYFIKCEKNGLSCFGVTPDDHERNKATARANGAF
jgi:UPF0755 protein